MRSEASGGVAWAVVSVVTTELVTRLPRSTSPRLRMGGTRSETPRKSRSVSTKSASIVLG